MLSDEVESTAEPGSPSGDHEDVVEIANSFGLHARASVKFAKLALTYRAKVLVSRAAGGEEVDGTNVLGLLTLGAEKGHAVRIRTRGEQAGEALAALVDLVRGKFDERS